MAAASLLTDYVMTVAVSIAAGVAALVSAFPELEESRVLLGIAAVGLVALMNLRGLRESGALFAVPTYGFIFCMAAMIGAGLFKVLTGAEIRPVHESFPTSAHAPLGFVFYLIVLKAFASGCAAMTGTEAVADGIPSFRPPESKNAAATLVYMAAILGFLFIGISILASVYHAVPSELAAEAGKGKESIETVVSQIARGVFGRGWFYYTIQLRLPRSNPANTAYRFQAQFDSGEGPDPDGLRASETGWSSRTASWRSAFLRSYCW